MLSENTARGWYNLEKCNITKVHKNESVQPRKIKIWKSAALKAATWYKRCMEDFHGRVLYEKSTTWEKCYRKKVQHETSASSKDAMWKVRSERKSSSERGHLEKSRTKNRLKLKVQSEKSTTWKIATWKESYRRRYAKEKRWNMKRTQHEKRRNMKTVCQRYNMKTLQHEKWYDMKRLHRQKCTWWKHCDMKKKTWK